MSFSLSIPRENPARNRRLTAVLLIAACLVMLVGLIQPASARPQAGPTLPMTLIINEVAWGGTRANSTHEWIELFNPGPAPVDLTNWKLELKPLSGGAIVTIDLAKSVVTGQALPVGGYYLLERFEAATSIPADLVYPNSVDLNDGGMMLQLVNDAGVTIDTANGDGGNWPAGSTQPTFCSMERVPSQQDTDAAWKDNCTIYQFATAEGGLPLDGTPRSANLTSPFTATPLPTKTGTVTPTPTNTHPPFLKRSVVINEVAWMGTRANYTSEWMELYNPGDAVNLNGWILRSKFGPLEIKLQGTIPKNGYFLLERNDDTAIIDIKADQIYFASSLLSDYGETLQLLDPNGKEIDTANNSSTNQVGPWPAGNYYYYCTMERAGADLPDVPPSWITNIGLVSNGHDAGNNRICGTPKRKNWAYSVTPTASLTPTPITPTRTPYPPYRTATKTKTPKKSPTATRNPFGPTPSYIILNEFLPEPRSDWNGDGKVDTGDEFIEIVNLGTKPVVLTGWSLDDQPGDSNPFSIGNVSIQPNAHMVFFGSQTGILLGNGGDSVRLIQPSGKVVDAFTYGVVRTPDLSWCRLPDGGPTWVFGCTPTIKLANRMVQSVIVGNRVESTICLTNKLPLGVQLAECDSSGLEIWNSALWEDRLPYPLYFDGGADTYIRD